MRHLLLLPFLSCLFYNTNAQDNPRLIGEINTTGASSNPQDITYLDGEAYFIADDGIHGRELWKSDGTEEGTVMVKDINPGLHHAFSEDPYNTHIDLIAVNNLLYLVANDGEHGVELWKSDGTEAGTKLVKDITPGSENSEIYELTSYNNLLYFSARVGIYSNELWKSDGTEAGTIAVEGEDALFTGSDSPQELTEVNGVLFFSAYDHFDGRDKLWRYDGTPPEIVYDISPSQLTAVGTTLYFVGNDGIYGREIWKSDGTETGTALVKDVYPGYTLSTPESLTEANGLLFFAHQNSENNQELWCSDGTEAGTKMVKDINSNSDPEMFIGSYPRSLRNMNGTLYFVADDGERGIELWKSDGTEIGTVMVRNITSEEGNHSKGSFPANLTPVGNTLYFTAIQGDNSQEALWKSDGTEAGTVLIKEIYQGNEYAFFNVFQDINGTLFFRADDGTNGVELWKSGGDESSTQIIKDININGKSSDVANLVKNDNHIYFNANGSNNSELWRTNGTTLSRFQPDWKVYSYEGDVPTMTSINNTLYFTSEFRKIFKTNGSVDQITPIDGIGENSSYYSEGKFSQVGNQLYFIAYHGAYGNSLWKTDGTNSGTVLVKDINPEINPSSYHHPYYSFTDVNGTLFFVTDVIDEDMELWKSDGTEAGTVRVKDINIGIGYSGSSFPLFLVNFNNTLFFRADDGSGSELWKSDGTEAGTVKIIDLSDGYPGGNPEDLVVSGGTLYFSAFDETHGRERWKSDGTEAGTVMVKEIQPGADFNFGPKKLFDANGTLYFTIDDGEHGNELWKSDGTEAGTVLVKDINPTGDSNIEDFLYVQDLLYFTADDGTHGQELWVTDGTEEGTKMIADIYPGAFSSTPTNKIQLNNQLVFTATTTLGKELWVYDLPNEAPASEDHSISVVEDSFRHFTQADFAFVDADANTLVAIKIIQSATVGSLYLDANANGKVDEGETAVSDNTEITAEQLTQLMYVPEPDGYGTQYDSFTFQVSDGITYSDARTLSIHVTPVADAPSVTDASTVYKQFTSDGLVITPNSVDGAEITYFAITGIQQGTLYLHDKNTSISDSTFISVAEAAKGLKFIGHTLDTGSFFVQACIDTTQMNWQVASTKAVITIAKAPQTISFADIAASVSVGDSILLTATASSELLVSYTISGPAVLEKNLLVMTEVGEIVIRASQTGNEYYQAAPEVSQTILAASPAKEEVITGIIVSKQEMDARVYPNPTLGVFQIETSRDWIGGTIQVTDIIGRIVYQQSVTTEGMSVNIHQEKPGFYITTLEKEGKRRVFKVLKR